MVKIDNVSFKYETKDLTLSKINLDIQEGECVLLCGESGCGKTTITKLVNGLIPHFVENGELTGTVQVDTLDVAKAEMYELAMKVGSVFQNPKSQFFNIDSDSEIVFGLENAGIPAEEMQDRLEETISDLKIQSLVGRNIFSMSGGEKQSLAFASVYAMKPSIFVLDEPTANLDAQAIDILKKQIVKVKQEGHTVIIAEHRLYFLMDVVDQVVFLQKGEISKVYSAEQFHRISEEQRIEMGLRSLQLSHLNLPSEPSKPENTGLSVQNLSCFFGKQEVFKNLNFSVQPGQVVGIIGGNGTGKTTLMRCLCGLLKQKSGTISLEGKVLRENQRNKESFCVMQDVNNQLFSDSVWNECTLSLEECPKEEIETVLKKFDLYEYKDKHPMALSGGQKQRLAVATAVLSGKNILVFDEPTSGLDYKRMVGVSEMITQLQKENKIILIVSHDYEFLNQTCDTIIDIEKNTAKKRVE